MRKESRHIVYVISKISKSLGFESILKALSEKHQLSVILLHYESTPFEEFLFRHAIPYRRIHLKSKKDFPLAFVQLFFYLLRTRPAVVHTHLFEADLLGLTASWLLGIRKRIYTRHNSTYHYNYFPHMMKYDRWCNRMATHIISISQATDYAMQKLEKVSPSKIRKIYHGFDLRRFAPASPQEISAMKQKWKIPGQAFVVGVVSRFVEWKGVQYIIPAFEQLLTIHPDSFLILANAHGPYFPEINTLLKNLPQEKYCLIPFEENITTLFGCFDVYVHTPIDPHCEAFGQTYIEALLLGIPSIFTASGIAAEIIKNEKHALLVRFRNSEDIYHAMVRLLRNKTLRQQISIHGKSIAQTFTLEKMINALNQLYDE